MTHKVSAWHYVRHTLFGLRTSFSDKTVGYASKGWGCLDADCPINAAAPDWVKQILRVKARRAEDNDVRP